VTVPPEVRGKFYALRGLAVVFGAFGAGFFLLRPNEFWIRSAAALGILASLGLIRRSNVYVWRARGQVAADWSPANRVGPLTWVLTGASLAACGAAYFLMYLDQLHDGKEAWPVYAFAVAVLALVITSGYVTLRILR